MGIVKVAIVVNLYKTEQYSAISICGLESEIVTSIKVTVFSKPYQKS